MKSCWAWKVLILFAALLYTCSLVVAATPVTPNASPQVGALLNYIHAMYGKKTLSGQMWSPWGIDEIETVRKITGKLPAIRGQDYIHERSNKRENQLAIECRLTSIRNYISSVFRTFKTHCHMTLSSKIINFIGLGLLQNTYEIAAICQVSVMKFKMCIIEMRILINMINTLCIE